MLHSHAFPTWQVLIDDICLSMESIRLGGPAHGIVAKTVHKTLPGGRWVGRGVLGVQGVGGG